MKKQLVAVGIIIILLTVGLSGCNEDNNTVQSDEDKIIGTWTNSTKYDTDTFSISYVFLLNKTFEIITSFPGAFNIENGTWNITDNKLLITLEGGGTITNDYKFSDNNTKLRIVDSSGSILDFIKQ